MTARVQVFGRKGCHLCADALAIVSEVCGDEGVGYEVFDVDTNPELKARYADEVPVVTVDGQVVGFWRVDATAIRQALRA